MTKRKGQKDKQHNDQKKRTERQTTQWPKRKGTEEQATMVLLVLLSFSFGHCVACSFVLFFWSLCCFTFCSLSFVHCVACSSVLFLVAIVHNGQKKRAEGQATQ
jgi:hypothetical protein